MKFAHTIFAMPFAAVGFVCTMRRCLPGARRGVVAHARGAGILLCMVFARNTDSAMAFNRWADRRIDAETPHRGPQSPPA